MADKDFLNWPFFLEQHHKLALALEEWCGKFSAGAVRLKEDQAARDLVQDLGDAGFLRHCVPAAFGGELENLDVRSLCICREILARHDGLLDFAFAMQGLGAGPLTLFGTEEQKKIYLPAVAAGEKIAAFALSEALAGSDVAQIETSAKADGSEFVLNGSKTWISNAGIADFYVVFARTAEGAGAKGLSAFVVDANTKGCSTSARIETTSPHPLGSLEFNNCRVSKDALIGKAGAGFKIAMATLDVFRSTVGAAALGFARRAFDEALKHSSARMIFGKKLFEHQMTQDKIANMAISVDASALLIYRAAWLKDQGAERVTREASMAKYFATESAQTVIDQALQLLGGSGVVKGSILERLYRDIRPLRIYEGTSEVQKIVIANQELKRMGGL